MTGQHPDPDRLTLAALPAEARDPDVADHLAGCARCREEVAVLRRTVDLARIGHADTATPPARVWQAIVDELDELDEPAHQPAVRPGPDTTGPDTTGPDTTGPDTTGPDTTGPTTTGPTTTGPATARARSRWRVAAVAAATAAAGLAAGLAIGFTVAAPATPPAATPLAQLQPVGPLDPTAVGAVGAASRDGVRELVIDVQGVSDTAGGDYLEAWVMDPAGARLVSLGALTRGTNDDSYQGTFQVPAELPLSAFSVVDISAERWDGDPTHSRISLLRGSML